MSKYDIFSFVGKDKIRPQLSGVFHDNGTMVATDSLILVTDSTLGYDPSLEGKVTNKKGEVIEHKNPYPKYIHVKPSTTEIGHVDMYGRACQAEDIDLDELESRVKSALAVCNKRNYSGCDHPVEIANGVHAGCKVAKKLLTLMRAKGVNRVYTYGMNRNMYVEGDGWWCVCTPCYIFR